MHARRVERMKMKQSVECQLVQMTFNKSIVISGEVLIENVIGFLGSSATFREM